MLYTVSWYELTGPEKSATCFAMQARSDAGVPRGPYSRPTPFDSDLKFAPGCSVTFGNPALQSPFVQTHLPRGEKFENRSSRAVSFCPPTGALVRGTTRTKETALEMASAWTWRWFNSLTPAKQNSFNSDDNPPFKKQRLV